MIQIVNSKGHTIVDRLHRNMSPNFIGPVRVGGACWTWKPGPLVQYLLGVIFCHWNFLFSCTKASGANIGIIANVVHL